MRAEGTPFMDIHVFGRQTAGNTGSRLRPCSTVVLALIFFGYFKSKVTGQPLVKGTIKVAMTGIIAAAAAYLLAKAVS